MDMNYLVQKKVNAQKAYRRKIVLAVALTAILLLLVVVGLIKVIMDEKKAEENNKSTENNVSENVTPGVTQAAPEEDGGGTSEDNGEKNTEQNGEPEAGTAEPAATATPSPTVTTEPTQSPTPTPVPKKKVAIDAGHGGNDLGSTRSGLYEKDANLAIAFYLQEMLLEAGYEVYMVRDTDVYVELVDRPAMAMESGADLFISIHLNSIDGDSDATRGTEVWYSDLRGEEGKVLAQYVVDEVVNSIGSKNRGIKLSNGLAVLKYSDVPTCLIECGFITSETERANLFDPEYQKKIAEGICNGIQKYLPVE